MHFWGLAGEGREALRPELLSLIYLTAFLLSARVISRLVPAIRALAIPDALLAGMLGLLFGSSALDVVPLDEDTLKLLVYHGGALIFLVLALGPKEPGKPSGAVRSYAFAIPVIASLQAIIGLVIVIVLGKHLGFGLMLPLGFSQGPGVALSMGEAWQDTANMPDGGQVGLMVSGLGFGVCCLFGVILFHLARRRGWLHGSGATSPKDTSPGQSHGTETGGIGPGSITSQLVLIGVVYLMTFSVLYVLSGLIGERPKLVAQLWGFHFLFALGLSVLFRIGLEKTPPTKGFVHPPSLNFLAGLVVDFTAAAAISAIRLDLLAHYWVVLTVMTLIGALLTATICVWLARRGFFDQPFEQILVMFGALTGTLPTGLTLLRLADPKLELPVARNYVMGAGASVLPAIGLLGLLPVVVSQPDRIGMWIGVIFVYALVLALFWWKLGGLRFVRPLQKFWPDTESHTRRNEYE